jgi:ribbon-helix-helix CopG family protein
MSDQLTVRLSPELNRALRAAARQMQLKSSEIVRMALRQYLAVPGPDGSRPVERVRGLIGSLDSAATDLAARHRASILASVKDGR